MQDLNNMGNKGLKESGAVGLRNFTFLSLLMLWNTCQAFTYLRRKYRRNLEARTSKHLVTHKLLSGPPLHKCQAFKARGRRSPSLLFIQGLVPILYETPSNV